MGYSDHLPSIVFSEATRPIFFKLHVEPSVKGGVNLYKWSWFIKMVAVPIYGNNTSRSSPEPRKLWG